MIRQPKRKQKRSSHYKAHLRVGLIMKPELISGHQLTAVPRSNPSQ
ncbi:hypothetical protein Salfasec13b_079 [Salmonella phage Salfasec13b]|nr:hypothetical protein Salfasec13b_079 [Salmonella phage Salfasec13b]